MFTKITISKSSLIRQRLKGYCCELNMLNRSNFVRNEIDPYGEIRGIESKVKTEKIRFEHLKSIIQNSTESPFNRHFGKSLPLNKMIP